MSRLAKKPVAPIVEILLQIKEGQRPTQGDALEEAIARRCVTERISEPPLDPDVPPPPPVYALTGKGEEYLAQQEDANQ